MVVMSFIMDKLPPGGESVNRFVHEMHKFYVIEQLVTHSTLRAVTVRWLYVQYAVAAAQRSGAQDDRRARSQSWGRSADRRRGHHRLARVLPSPGMQLACPPGITSRRDVPCVPRRELSAWSPRCVAWHRRSRRSIR